MSAITTSEQADQELILDPEELQNHAKRAEEQCGLVVDGDQGMMRALEETVLVSRSKSIITLTGEPGTGKELFARFIHQNRHPTDDKPLVVINMAGIPEELILSELFGHRKGSFTGAITDRVGRIEEAQDGTIFLDEVGDTPFSRQAGLLRFLAQREFSRVGDSKVQSVAADIVCATNVDIHHAMRLGRMRQDLHDRLSACIIVIPPFEERTREHRVNVTLALLRKIGASFGIPDIRIDDDALAMIIDHPGEGNVRGIENTLGRVVCYAAAKGKTSIDIQLMRRAVREMNRSYETSMNGNNFQSEMMILAKQKGLRAALLAVERRFVREVLEETGGNQTRAANVLRVTRAKIRQRSARNGFNDE